MIQGVLLAAGRARRFGGQKLLATLADGTPVGLAAASNLRAALPQVLAVVSPDDRELSALFEAIGITTLSCHESAYGMGHSLAAGIAASAEAAGWVIALADMPVVQPSTIMQVATAVAQGAVLAAPSYHGRRGQPVGFSRALRDDLLACRGDSGARHIVAARRSEMELINVDDPGIHIDIDEPAGLLPLQRSGG